MSSSRAPRSSLTSSRAAGAVLLTGVNCTCASGICSSNWYGLCLSMEVWGRADCEDDDEVGGVGW